MSSNITLKSLQHCIDIKIQITQVSRKEEQLNLIF